MIGHCQNAACFSFHRVGAQDTLSPSPKILRSERLLSFQLGDLESRPCSRGTARAAAEPLRGARSDGSVRSPAPARIRFPATGAPKAALAGDHPKLSPRSGCLEKAFRLRGTIVLKIPLAPAGSGGLILKLLYFLVFLFVGGAHRGMRIAFNGRWGGLFFEVHPECSSLAMAWAGWKKLSR
jgi:hypothetical protein